ncbi:MAG TPA: DUF2059 domain-containing protein [Phenylobacterium sp.]|jgi:hypothetical protein
MTRHNGPALLMALALLIGPGPLGAQAAAPPAGSSAPAAATPDPKSVALVRRYLAAIHFEQLLDTMMASIIPVMTEGLTKQYPSMTEQQRSTISDVVRETMREDYTPKMIERMVPIYARTFSQSELEAIVAFYESPAGRAVMDKSPSLAPKSAEVARELLPELQKDVIRRLCAKIDCLGGKPAPPPKATPS